MTAHQYKLRFRFRQRWELTTQFPCLVIILLSWLGLRHFVKHSSAYKYIQVQSTLPWSAWIPLTHLTRR
ncbi:hypothetical protein BGY98DRAFT_978434 [Russula aff. rugulosa BPL654]|nr:hypothetical protein BGY98DRAFT_978434 [Russula aff. rugulosa BPL654]